MPLHLHNPVSQAELEETLAREPYERSVFVEYQNIARGLKTSLAWAGMPDETMTSALKRTGHPPNKKRIVATQLRLLVDDWIDTGLGFDGSEDPGSRYLPAAKYAYPAFQACIVRDEGRVRINPVTGDLSIHVLEKTYHDIDLELDFFHRALHDANYLFTGLFLSQFRDRLCKCRYEICGRYFFLEKQGKQTRNGTFCCREHQHHATAAKATQEKRERMKLLLLNLAAEALLGMGVNGNEWRFDGDRKRSVAKDVTVEMARNPNHRQDAVTLNWVTRNSVDIETRRIALARAKSRQSRREN